MTILKSEGFVNTALAKSSKILDSKCSSDDRDAEEHKYSLLDCSGAFLLLGLGILGGILLRITGICKPQPVDPSDVLSQLPSGVLSPFPDEPESAIEIVNGNSNAALDGGRKHEDLVGLQDGG